MPRSLKWFSRTVIVLVVFAGLLFYYARFIEPERLRIEEITITSSHLPAAADEKTILVFADTHFGVNQPASSFDRVLSTLSTLDPDIVVFLGDLIDDYEAYPPDEAISEIIERFSKIQAPYGTYAVFGNHDYGGGAETIFPEMMRDAGFHLLVNETLLLEELGLLLIGIDDVIIGYGDPSIAKEADPSLYNIVLTHAPDVADQVLEAPVDLILAGHTHGKQVNLPFFDKLSLFNDLTLPPYGKNYTQGLYDLPGDRNPRLYVNRGLGTTKLPLRFLSVPELTLITLRCDPS